MEESSEKRRDRLRAMRQEASLAYDGGGGSSMANPPDPPGFPLLSDLQQPPRSPSRRFEFYTDPLAAFSGSQRNKKSRNGFGSGVPPREPVVSPLRQPPNLPGTGFSTPSAPFPSFSRIPNSNANLNLTPPGSFSPTHGHLNNSYPFPSHNPISRENVYPSSTPPGGFNTPSSSNPGSSAFGTRSTPYSHNGVTYTKSPVGSGGGSLSAQSSQRQVARMHENFVQSYGSNLSGGSFKRSPGSSSRGTPGKWGRRGFHRSNSSYSDSITPESFAKRSMLEDPWKDLVPVRIESVAFRLDSCSVPSSQDWLPKSIGKMETSPSSKGVSVSASGPSLAESLAASFADAVEGEDFT